MTKTRGGRTESLFRALSSQHCLYVCPYVCLWHSHENLSEGPLFPKKESVPDQTCFSTINDKLVQGSVPCGVLCWLNAKHILIVLGV